MKKGAIAFVLAGFFAITAHAQGRSSAESAVLEATVVQVVQLQEKTDPSLLTQAGTGLLGGLAGGALGNQMGKGSGKTALTALGALGGAIGGVTLFGGSGTPEVVQVIVRMKDGGERAIKQTAQPDAFSPGDSVRIIQNAGEYKIVKSN